MYLESLESLETGFSTLMKRLMVNHIHCLRECRERPTQFLTICAVCPSTLNPDGKLHATHPTLISKSKRWSSIGTKSLNGTWRFQKLLINSMCKTTIMSPKAIYGKNHKLPKLP